MQLVAVLPVKLQGSVLDEFHFVHKILLRITRLIYSTTSAISFHFLKPTDS